MEKFERKEYKYFVPIELLDPLRRRFLANMEHDSFCREREYNRYTVRSIYFDTCSFLFYFEKIDSLNIRKKLRIRTYNLPEPGGEAFLEIKRKFGNTIHKERVRILLEDAPILLNGAQPRLLVDDPSFVDKAMLERFIYLMKRLQLEPVSLVAYEREAMQGADDTGLRVTFDQNVRTYPYPAVDQIFREEDLRTINDTHFILEIKFYDRMPIFARNIVREFRLRLQSISKYCNGLDVWLLSDGKIHPTNIQDSHLLRQNRTIPVSIGKSLRLSL